MLFEFRPSDRDDDDDDAPTGHTRSYEIIRDRMPTDVTHSTHISQQQLVLCDDELHAVHTINNYRHHPVESPRAGDGRGLRSGNVPFGNCCTLHRSSPRVVVGLPRCAHGGNCHRSGTCLSGNCCRSERIGQNTNRCAMST